MSDITYPWQRYLCPHDGKFSLDEYDFLATPRPEGFFDPNPDLLLPEQILGYPCAVILGQPGIGKSAILRHVYDDVSQQFSDEHNTNEIIWIDLGLCQTFDDVRRELFDTSVFENWKSGTHDLLLFVDSLDEGMLRIDTLSRQLINEFDNIPHGRLKLYFACRTSEWRGTFQERLLRLYSLENLPVFEAMPLRREDIALAADLNGYSSDAFLQEIISRNVSSFASQPNTLKFLIESYRADQSFPETLTRYSLFYEGCLSLCSEHDEDRQRSPIVRPLQSPDRRLLIAARIAILTMFCNKVSVSTDTTPASLLTENLAIQEIVGQLPDDTTIGENEIRDALSSALFTSRGTNRLGWAHRSYEEFLAAYHLIQNKFSIKNLVNLISTSNHAKFAVIPQLREVAAWLATKTPQIQKILAQCEPYTLLRSDPLALTDTTKQDLLVHLFQAVDAEEIFESYELRSRYNLLCYPYISDFLQGYLTQENKTAVRMMAIDIAESCHTRNLARHLVQIAVDPKEQLEIRENAAHAVAKLGDDVLELLKPLMYGDEADINDELKGAALANLWPIHISTQELFENITLTFPPKSGEEVNYLADKTAQSHRD